MNFSGIYQILNVVSGDRYIGSAVKLKRRFKSHNSCLNLGKHPNIHLQRAYDKYGAESFEFRVLEFVEDKTKLLEKEQGWIDWIKPRYNICVKAGSNLGRKFAPKSEEYKANMSASMKGRVFTPEWRAKLSAWQIGRKMSPEARVNMSKARLGNQSRRNSKKWPHADGCYCKCDSCFNKRKTIKKCWDNDLVYVDDAVI